MSQIPEDYQQVSSGFSLSPRFVDSAFAAFENRGGAQEFFDLFNRDGMPSNMVKALERPFKFVNSHELSQAPIIRAA